MKAKNSRGVVVSIIIIVAIIAGLYYLIGNSKKPDKVNDSDIMKYFDDLQVEEYNLDLGTGEIELKIKGKDEKIEYKVPSVPLFVNSIDNES